MSQRQPLSARSVILSVMLGSDPPALPVGWLVRVGELFDISPGTVRTALTRMTQRNELERSANGWYSLAGAQLLRAQRQRESQMGTNSLWNGRWQMGVATLNQRAAKERTSLRADMNRLRFATLREGVWMRPDNLDPQRLPQVRERVSLQLEWFFTQPFADSAGLAARLWDLGEWSAEAKRIEAELVATLEELDGVHPQDQGAAEVLRSGFEIAADALRHLQRDPLLPEELWPKDWRGRSLRRAQQRFDQQYRAALQSWV